MQLNSTLDSWVTSGSRLRITCSEMTDDSDDDELELSRVSGSRFGMAGGHLERDAAAIMCTPASYTQHTNT